MSEPSPASASDPAPGNGAAAVPNTAPVGDPARGADPAPASPPLSLLGRPVRQIALVVEDLEVSVRAYADALGVGPWNVYTIGAPAMTGMTYRGEPADFVIRHALAFSGEVMLELVQPVGGPSIWQEYLD